MKTTKTLKVGDIIEMNFGIEELRITYIVSKDRVDACSPEDLNSKGIGIPVYWIKRKKKQHGC